MALDLSSMKRFVEKDLMTDKVTITRAVDGDGTWNPETMMYEDGGLPRRIYCGKCYISQLTSPEEIDEGGVEKFIIWHFVNIPINSPIIMDGDVVTVDYSLRHKNLQGVQMIAETDNRGTFKVKEKIRCRRIVNQDC